MLDQPLMALMGRAIDICGACHAFQRVDGLDKAVTDGVDRQLGVVGELELFQYPRAVHTDCFGAEHQFLARSSERRFALRQF